MRVLSMTVVAAGMGRRVLVFKPIRFVTPPFLGVFAPPGQVYAVSLLFLLRMQKCVLTLPLMVMSITAAMRTSPSALERQVNRSPVPLLEPNV